MKYQTGRPPFAADDTMLDPADPQVTAELRAATGQIPYHMVDWDGIRASIVGDAAALFQRRVRRPWTAYVARWSLAALPVGLAASFVAGMFVLYTSHSVSQMADEASLSPASVLNTVTGISTSKELAATVIQPIQAGENRLLEGVVP